MFPMAPRNRRASCGGRMQNTEEEQPSLPEAAEGKLEQPSSGQASGPGGQIRVAVRVRPLLPNEQGIIEVAGTKTVLIEKQASNGGNGFLSSQQGRIETRSFDRVFGHQATQKEVYETTCAPLVSEAVAAARCATIFAYGATGAGKTHTMFGVPEDGQHGIILRAVPDIFKAVEEYNARVDNSEPRLQVKASFLEIYNETVRDLLQDGGAGGMCRVLEDERAGIVKVSNLYEPAVESVDAALRLLEAGMQSRTIESTAANLQSSRSHGVFTLTIERVAQRPVESGLRSRLVRGSQIQRQFHSKISFIDLAGSERATQTQNVGQALKDGARINQSLLALANCIDALIVQSRLANNATTPRKKPPYRDSKLTLILKSALVGDGLVAMIANVHPGSTHFEDSNNTLEYAKRASTVKATNRRLSMQSFVAIDEIPSAAASVQQEGDEYLEDAHAGQVDDLDDESIAHTQSTSSLPEPQTRSEPQTRPDSQRPRVATMPCSRLPKPQRKAQLPEFPWMRRKHQLPEFHGNLQKSASSCEITTASSPEECLSEISLSYLEEEAEVAIGSNLSPSSSMASSGGARQESADSCGVEQRVATELAEKLQRDNERMEARLSLVTCERNSLLRDRQALEEENERLREENIEKDRQLVLLLGRSDLAWA